MTDDLAKQKERWARIQDGEFDYHAGKDPDAFQRNKIAYWKSLLGTLPEDVQRAADRSALDVGCGGASLLLALEGGRRRVGLDPLMDRYLDRFPYLREAQDIRWMSGAVEEATFEGEFDAIFALNSLDHVYDAAGAARRIASWLAPGGFLVVTLNTHNTAFFRAYYAAFYRLIDSHHPYQWTTGNVQRLFGNLEPVLVREIDDLWLPFATAYYRQVLGREFEDRRKWLRAVRNPFKWPMGFCKVALDMPPHKKRPGQRSIYSERLFVFRR